MKAYALWPFLAAFCCYGAVSDTQASGVTTDPRPSMGATQIVAVESEYRLDDTDAKRQDGHAVGRGGVVRLRRLGGTADRGLVGQRALVRDWDLRVLGATKIGFNSPVIKQRDKVFSPSEITTVPGTTWRIDNDDNVPHSIQVTTPDGERRNLGMQSPGDFTDVGVDKLGEYIVRCGIHPKMKLTIQVR